MLQSASERLLNFFQLIHTKLFHPTKPALVSVRHVKRAFKDSDLSSLSSFSDSEGDQPVHPIGSVNLVNQVDPCCVTTESTKILNVDSIVDEDVDGLEGVDLFRCGNQVRDIN